MERRGRLASTRQAAIGFCHGSLLRHIIEQQGTDALERATAAAAAALGPFETNDGFEAPLSAHVVTATR